MKKIILSLILSLSGFGLCFYFYDWKLALIIFLCLWGNNIEIKK